MATPGFGFAEIYVQRKLFKEKLKSAQAHQVINDDVHDNRRFANSSGGCFFWLSKNYRKKTTQVTDCDDDDAKEHSDHASARNS